MKLKELLKFDDIVIQCHNFPDADTIASGYGLYCFLTHYGKKPLLIYGGKKEITKPNLRLMIEKLDIPLEYIAELPRKPQLIITADCVHGESNTADFEAENYAAVDHHVSVKSSSPLYDIRPSYSSCSSVVAVLLDEAGFDYNSSEQLATALYYGLYTDSDGMKEISFPADRDLRDFARYNKLLFSLLINSNLSLAELNIAGKALENVFYNTDLRYAAACAEECDPNILGFINDLIITVDSVDTSVVCCPVSGGVKFSVRSCNNIIDAAELAEYIADDTGSGGGHSDKAGGFINLRLASLKNKDIKAEDPIPYFNRKMAEFFVCFDVVDSDSYTPDISSMKEYVKAPRVQGAAKSTDIFPEGTDFGIRTLEGDMNIKAAEDTYIMINGDGSIYPIKKDKFEKTYSFSDDEFIICCDYMPSVISKSLGHGSLLPHAKSCIAESGSCIYAAELTRRMKLRTKWDREGYMSGKEGDYLAVRPDDITDMYIITKKQFEMMYKLKG